MSPALWALAAASAFLFGVSKTGVPGLGILPVVMMLWVIPDQRAGPVMSLYLLSMNLPRDQFIATGAWCFLVIDLVKVPLLLLPDATGHARW